MGLFGRLGASARVTVVAAPPGSGKTVLLRSWIGEAGLADSAAWVPVGREERDPQRFWLAVLGALRQTTAGSGLVRELTAAPDLDGWAITERLLKDLAPLAEPVWLVVDDVHHLGSAEALRQLELLMMRAPDALRFVLATRHDLRLGLHRLRLKGELTEIRAADLRFTVEEARALFAAAGVQLSEPELARLYERTEGWAAGLRLAALSLSGHPDPGRFAAEFSGSERTVAGYLLAEVLERQPEEVRRLLLRTSVLERVSGPLADALTGDSGGERVLQDLENANAFVVSLDAGRAWFRYHQLFADLLQLELRGVAPGEVTGLHRVAAQWFAEYGFPVEAIRHTQGAQDWGLAARLLADHWPGLHLGGQAATVHAILAGFPADVRAADAELAAVAAADELAQGSLAAAERYLEAAARGAASVPAARRGQAQLLLGIIRLLAARQRGNLPAVAEEARRLQAEAPEAARPGLGEELRALALVSLGIAEFWAARFEDAAAHLEQGVAVARRIGRPYLEVNGLAYQALAYPAPVESGRSFARAAERGRQAVELAERHGWTDDPAVGIAYLTLAGPLIWQGRPGEAEPWVQRAERTVRAEAEPAAALAVYYVRGVLELGRDVGAALAAFRATERLFGHLAAPHHLVLLTQAMLVHALVRVGALEQAGQVLAGLGVQDRDRGEIRVAAAALRLARHDPHAATAVLAPILDGSAPLTHPVPWRAWPVSAFLLEAIARDALGDLAAAARALERALDLAEPDRVHLPFLLYPAPGLLERHDRDCARHAALVAEILSLLPPEPGPADPVPRGHAGPKEVRRGGEPPRDQGGLGHRPPGLIDPLTKSETRVLRYLPTNLTAPEIARELSVSVTTVRTHISRLFTKLGAHRRTEAVTRARTLGLLAPSPYTSR